MKAVVLAERAALGALLVEAAAGDITRWLRPEDFVDPWHAETYAVIRGLRAAGHDAGPEAVGRELLRRLGPTRAAVVGVADLVHDLPVRANLHAYAVMVLEASLRREAAAQGVLLRAGTLQATLEGSARPLIVITSLVDAALDAAADRWAAATAAPRLDRPLRTPRRVRAGVANAPGGLAADRFLAAHPAPTVDEVAEREAILIAALITHPEHISLTAKWLRSVTLTNDTWRPVYEAMLRLHADRRPIDVVTVLWETQRAGLTTGPGPEVSAVMKAIERAAATNPSYAARQVSADHLRLAAEGAAAGLAAAAANPGLDIREVLGTGRILTDALRAGAKALTAPGGAGRIRRALHVVPVREIGPVAG